jgi:putative phage-type endonuclease
MSNFVRYLLEIPQPEQRSKEWYEQRGNMITSSNIATILDMNPYKKSTVYLNELIHGTNDFKGNIATIHGTYFEDPAINAYMDAFGYSGVNLGLIRLIDNKQHRNIQYIEEKGIHWLAGSLDKLVWPSEITEPTQADCIAIEAKCPFNQPQLKFGTVKGYYWPQVQFNMYISDTDKADYIECVPKGFKGNSFKMNVVRVYRDDAWLNGFAIPKLEQFHAEWKDKKQRKK